MKNKLIISLVVFLLLIPLRLPISILFIHFFEWIIGVTTTDAIPSNILATNVIVTKLVYNIALSSYFIYSIEMFSRETLKRNPHEKIGGTYFDRSIFWWTVPIAMLLIAFIIIDAISVQNIFFK